MTETKRLVMQGDEVLVAELKTLGDGITAPGSIILVCRSIERHPYVTWWYNSQSGGRCSGHYHETLSDAAHDFAERIKRHFPQPEPVGATND